MKELKKIKNNTKGITLVEVLLYVVISSLMLTSIVFLMSAVIESRIKNQTIADVENQGRKAIEIITQTIRNAEAITAPGSGSTSSTLTLDVLTPANDPTIISETSGKLRIKEGTAATIALTNSRVEVTSISFENLSRTNTPGVVRIILTLSHVNPSGRNEYDFTKTFYGSASIRK